MSTIDGGKNLICGPGTHEQSGQCVLDGGSGGSSGSSGSSGSGGSGGGSQLVCGPGTHESDGVCLPDALPDGGSNLTCGPGTHLEGVSCLPGDPIDTIEVSPLLASVGMNGKTTFTATAKHQGAVVSGVAFTWSSASPANATIDAVTGEATGVAAGTTDITAKAQGITSAPATLTVLAGPVLAALEPSSGPSGLPVEIDGMGFGATQGTSQVMFGAAAANILSWSDGVVVARVPDGAAAGVVDVQITQTSGSSNKLPFTITTAPYVLSVAPRSSTQGGKITLRITGANLGTCTVAINRNGVPDAAFAIDNAGKIVDQFGVPGQADLLHVDVDVSTTAALGDVAVSCGASTTALTGDDVFSVVASAGTMLGVAGNGTSGLTGDGGAASAAQLASPGALALGPQGELYIADTGNNRIRVANLGASSLSVAGVTVPAGAIATLAGGAGMMGNTAAGYAGDGGPAIASQLSAPAGLSYDTRGLLFVADSGNHCVRVINLGAAAVTLPMGVVNAGGIALVAGAGGMAGSFGDGGAALAARFNGPLAVAVDSLGLLYVADTGNNRVRAVNVSNSDVTSGLGTIVKGNVALVAGSSAAGSAGDGAQASAGTQLNQPGGLAVDAHGILLVADTGNHKIRAINTTAATLTLLGAPKSAGLGLDLAAGFVDTLVGAGGAGSYSGDGECVQATSPYPGGGLYYFNQLCTRPAHLSAPVGLAPGPLGELFIADQNNNRVRLAMISDSPVHRAGNPYFSGGINLLAGNGQTTAGAPDPQPASAAQLFGPLAVAYDHVRGQLFIADTLHHRIRRVEIGRERDATSGELGAWPADFTSGTATLDVDTGALSYTGMSGPTVMRLGPTDGVFSFTGKIRVYTNTTLDIVGGRSAVIAATGDIQIDGTVNVHNGGLDGGEGGAMIGSPGHGAVGTTGYGCGTYYFVYYGGNTYGNPEQRPVTGGTGLGANVAGALVLSAGGSGNTGKLLVAGAIHADSGGSGSCATGGSGGGLRLVATNQIQITGSLTAAGGFRSFSNVMCCGNTPYTQANGGSVGRIRLEAPSVTTTGPIVPAASVSSALPAPQPWL